MSDTPSKVSPIVAIAATSIIIFSAVGVGVMTGVIPSSFSNSEPHAADAAKDPVTASQPAKPATGASQPARTASAAPQPARKPHRAAEAKPAAEPARVAANQVCATCGTVSAVNVVEHAGEGSGLGAIGGAVVGGVLGNQVGRGTGRTVATVAGAAGGAYAGHEIEKQVKKSKSWDVVVRMDDGTSRVFPFQSEPGYRIGDKVKVTDGALTAR